MSDTDTSSVDSLFAFAVQTDTLAQLSKARRISVPQNSAERATSKQEPVPESSANSKRSLASFS